MDALIICMTQKYSSSFQNYHKPDYYGRPAGSRARCIPIYVFSHMFENVMAKITAI